MTTSTFTTTHVREQTEKQFGEVTRDFERPLGKFDPAVFQALRSDAERVDDARARIEAMAGSSGFMLLGTTDHETLLSVFGVKKKAIQYIVGNPLIAIQMTQHNLAAGLYAPLRVLAWIPTRGESPNNHGLVFRQFPRISAFSRLRLLWFRKS